MIVGFTGTRQGPTPAQHRAMSRLLLRLPITRFVHGGARNCDTFAHHIVTARGLNKQIVVEIHPADRDAGTTVTIPSGNSEIWPATPPLERNRVIVSRVHGLIAVPATDTEGQSGTWATIRYARQIGCPCYIIKRSGRVVRDVDPMFT